MRSATVYSDRPGTQNPWTAFRTAEPTGLCQSYTIIKMTLDLPGVLCR
jgi:hypothetical protein